VDLIERPPDPAAFLTAHGLDPARPVVALLPGSRRKEVAANLPPLAAALPRIRAARPEVQFLLALAASLERSAVEPRLAGLGVTVVQDETHAALGSAELALVASGTATVETALLGTPMLVVYRLSSLTYALGRPFMRVADFAMVNLIAGRRVVPELIQGDFTPERVAEEALRLLGDTAARQAMRDELARVRDLLGPPGASSRAADCVMEMLNGR
jgi:lipid-A-disaccharide synthase